MARRRPEPKPLHPPGWPEYVFQHPVKGCAYALDPPRSWKVYVNDVGEGADPKDAQVHNRYELGAWLTKTQPKPELEMIHQAWIDEVYPLNWDTETTEGKALYDRLDMATSVMSAGGACTLCKAEPNEDKFVTHNLGCELLSLILHLAQPKEADDDSLAAAIRKANEQIARMA